MAVDTVDNPIAYHNFIVIGTRVFPSAFLFVVCWNTYHGVPVQHDGIVANSPTLDGVIFNCHNLGSLFYFERN